MDETTFVNLFMLILIVLYCCHIYVERTRSKKANRIANYMVDIGIRNTTTGNYIFAYPEINEMFRVNLPKDRNLLLEILDILYDRYDTVIAELDWDQIQSAGFDFIFYLDYCPNLED